MAIPTTTLTLASLAAIMQDGPDVGTAPDIVPREAEVTLTPVLHAGAAVRVTGEPGAYTVEAQVHRKGTVVDSTPWPLSTEVANLADPRMITDATRYRVTIRTLDGLSERVISGDIELQATDTGQTRDLAAMMPVAASPLSPIVRGPSAYDVAVANGYSGTESQWIASLAGGMAVNTAVAGVRLSRVGGTNGLVTCRLTNVAAGVTVPAGFRPGGVVSGWAKDSAGRIWVVEVAATGAVTILGAPAGTTVSGVLTAWEAVA